MIATTWAAVRFGCSALSFTARPNIASGVRAPI